MTELAFGKVVEREFPMTDGNFNKIKEVAYQLTGINLSEHKKNMIYGRLARRLRHLNLVDFDEYCSLITQASSPEKIEFINAITTNLTSFFREPHHFNYLADSILPELQHKNSSSQRIRIWSAGCSTGEEPYSIAMVAKSFPALQQWDLKILASDLDSSVVAKARAGVYSLSRAENIPDIYRKYLGVKHCVDLVKVKKVVQEMITFQQLNLLHEWPMKGSFDVIFCRNVVIYFDVHTRRQLFSRFADLLTVGGYLVIGHSENLHNISTRFKSLGKTIYQRIN